jgi:hypothetical protein
MNRDTREGRKVFLGLFVYDPDAPLWVPPTVGFGMQLNFYYREAWLIVAAIGGIIAAALLLG